MTAAPLIAITLGVLLGTAAVAATSSDKQSEAQLRCRSFSGNISWYGTGFQGKRTASGELFDMYKSTAAHPKLPFQTKVLVEDPKTGKTAIVKVNDRGPFVRTRVMDVSREGGRRLGILSSGVRYVDCLVVDDNADTKSP